MKKRSKHRNSSEAGMAILVALIFISVALILLGGLALRLVSQNSHVAHFVQHKEAFLGVEAAYIESKLALEQGNDGMIGLGGWDGGASGGNLTLPSFEAQGVAPVPLASVPGVSYMAYVQDWFTDGIDNNGDGIVDGSSERWHYTIHSFAQQGEHVRQVEAIVRGRDVNVWRNAIFAGGGQAGGLINGNVSIHGSVHLLGDNLIEGASAITAIDMSGTSMIRNNYIGIPANLAQRIPPLRTVTIDGEQLSTIDAELRVKNGLVSMSGNSKVGEAQSGLSGSKGPVDGTYVNDGWTGNSVQDDGNRGIPTQVVSDNGWNEFYDLGNRVSFPLLTDDWREPVTGARAWNEPDGAWYSHEDYFNEVLVGGPALIGDGVYNGDIDLFTRGSHFYWNSTTGIELDGSLPAQLPPVDQNYIMFDADTKVLRINGQVTINGDLRMRGQGNDRTIHYSGRAALLVYGDVNLDISLLSCNNGDPNNVANSFPVNNIIGIMSTQNMMVGSSAQASIMGAFYAQNAITTQRQTNVIGTFVSQFFNMGTNVPSIYQVPALADNLPYGMIGNYPILSLQQISWRELGVDI